MRSRFADTVLDTAGEQLPRFGGATFTLRFRLMRLTWVICWFVLAAWTPSPCNHWRVWLLRCFGARVHSTAVIRGSARIWWPANLAMGQHTSMGPGVLCYNVADVTLGDFSIVSQRAHLCTGTHDVDDKDFPLVSLPITIQANAWIAAEAFVGPGVLVGEGAVLGARAVAARALAPWTIYVGNPAKPIRRRRGGEFA
ncbi:putative colanic acid biosynthesis acetyltransferase [Phyllobacterium sp. OV277]|uniref:putative colanic acid biosynthesis acetyltransferase n=1 Tax=Phyllobacterium sp. OV277 TaxID=1882772 RepID=UPI0008909C20|nr:putative colanic acid biosynthesis acetyltransferase [Phyllobacterium sp. OV277]SDP38450.1 putative colanic acid biosynthesis acetyltransferase WcaF [Phyllobacterium sp. OV277]